jgi:S1-C subfamily serine protease
MKPNQRDLEKNLSSSNSEAGSSNRSFDRSILYLLIVLLGGGVILDYWFNHRQLPFQSSDGVPQAAPPGNLVNTPRTLAAFSNSIATVIERVGPAVVQVNSGGIGSGFIINADGQILTNAHVVDGADTVTVKLRDGRKFKGKVLVEDTDMDVAVVKIPAQNLPTVQLGNSDQLLPGQEVIAIGNPLGFDTTVSIGTIAATGQITPKRQVEFLQTDAAIYSGNSGGPLLNQEGQAIAINTAITQGTQGTSLAIPINKAKRITEQLNSKKSNE